MIKIMVKYPEQQPEIKEVDSLQTLEELMEGEFEIAQDDLLPEIYILIRDEARGIAPHNFTIQTEGSHDWIYGPAVFISMKEEQVISLTEQQMNEINTYFAKTRAYK